MKKTVYLAAAAAQSEELPLAQTGFCFLEDGTFTAPPPQSDVLILDDRCLPSARGAADAASFFRSQTNCTLICDFERPCSADLRELLSTLQPEMLIVPPQYADLPHAAVFMPPYRLTRGFRQWLAVLRKRYGKLVLDLQPICCRSRPGQAPHAFTAVTCLHSGMYFSEALYCNYRLQLTNDGLVEFLFRDDFDTFRLRADAAGCPCIVPEPEYRSLLGIHSK